MSTYEKLTVFAAVTGLLLLQAGCQQQAKTTQEPATAVEAQKGGPKIEFESLEYDFGKVGPGRKLNGQFKFTNAGDAQLKITKVEKCCGAVTKVDKEELAPGESGVLQVTYTSSRLAGKMMKRLYVNSNDKATPRETLTIKAETVLKVAYEPRSLKLRLNEENAGCPKIALTSTDNQPFSISSFKVTNNCLAAEIDSSVAATEFVLEPKVDMEKIQKIKSGRITIGLAYPQTDTPPETASIYFQVLSKFTAKPSMLVMLYNTPEPVTKSLWITNNYGEDFDVESTSSREGRVKVLSQKKTAGRYQFLLEITPPADAKAGKFTDVLTINLTGDEKLDVSCRGIYRAPSTEKAGQ